MKLSFKIEYRAPFGQSMHACIKYTTKDKHQYERNVLMHTDDGHLWQAETSGIMLNRPPIDWVTYYYQLEDNNGKVCRKEWTGVPRCFVLDESKNYIFQDIWRDLAISRYLFPLSKRPKTKIAAIPQFNRSVIFRVSAPQVEDTQCVALLGSEAILGRWNETRYLPLQYVGDGDWMLSINAEAIGIPFEFKYVIVDNQSHEVITWENGDNRTIGVDRLDDSDQLVVYGGNVRTPCKLVFHDELFNEDHTLNYEVRDLYI